MATTKDKKDFQQGVIAEIDLVKNIITVGDRMIGVGGKAVEHLKEYKAGETFHFHQSKKGMIDAMYPGPIQASAMPKGEPNQTPLVAPEAGQPEKKEPFVPRDLTQEHMERSGMRPGPVENAIVAPPKSVQPTQQSTSEPAQPKPVDILDVLQRVAAMPFEQRCIWAKGVTDAPNGVPDKLLDHARGILKEKATKEATAAPVIPAQAPPAQPSIATPPASSAKIPSEYINPAARDLPIRDQGDRRSSAGCAAAAAQDVAVVGGKITPSSSDDVFVQEMEKRIDFTIEYVRKYLQSKGDEFAATLTAPKPTAQVGRTPEERIRDIEKVLGHTDILIARESAVKSAAEYLPKAVHPDQLIEVAQRFYRYILTGE